MKRLNIKMPEDLHAYGKSAAALEKVSLQEFVVKLFMVHQQQNTKPKGKK